MQKGQLFNLKRSTFYTKLEVRVYCVPVPTSMKLTFTNMKACRSIETVGRELERALVEVLYQKRTASTTIILFSYEFY